LISNGTPMTHERKQILNPDELVYLSLEQAANICCVSEERFGKWIEKGLVPVIEVQGQKLVRSRDLIQHLIHHNIRIPERLLQGSIKKILFIVMENDLPQAMTADIIWTLYRLRQHPAYVFDFIELDSTTELKIITFDPDLIFLLQHEEDTETARHSISRMLGKEVPIHLFPVNREIDIDLLFND
jgi:hypothetical protein